MSLFLGCIILSNVPGINTIASQMEESTSFFKADATGVYKTDEIYICNKLLHNTPESLNTPLLCRNERYVLAASCRLDNREELALKLNLSDAESDHEYLLRAFSIYGEACLEHLIGDFSMVVWDVQEEKLFMAKDQLGIRPLFYFKNADVLLFSTCIAAIKAITSIRFELNEIFIAKELKGFYQNHKDTFYRDIKRLKPSHFTVFDKKNATISKEQPYWELKPMDISTFKTEEGLYNELRHRLTEAVRCRTRTIKNVGCQLSGGLDSSAIAVLLSRNVDPSKLFTYSFILSDKTRAYSERGIDEQETQLEILNYSSLKKENHIPIEDFHYADVFEQLSVSHQIMGGYSNFDCIWQDSLFRQAQRQNVGVMMSGFIGDEGISNYGANYYFDYLGDQKILKAFSTLEGKYWQRFKKIVSYYRFKLKGTTHLWFHKVQKSRNLLHRESEFHTLLTIDKEYFKFYPTFKEYLKNNITRPHICQRTESEYAYALQYGMETAYPLADIRLLQLVYSLPTEMFKPAPLLRSLFRNICIPVLPDKVRLQPKYNGATTLAFNDYWQKKQLEELKGYKINDYLQMFEPIANLQLPAEETERLLLLRYHLDFFISKEIEEWDRVNSFSLLSQPSSGR